MSIITTPEAPHSQLEVTPFNSYCLAIEQGISYLLSSRSEQPLNGGTRDAHLLSTLFLFQPFQIFEAYRFRFLHREANLIKNPQGNPRRLEICDLRDETNPADSWWPTHAHDNISSVPKNDL
jgi:hypothetical protein